MGRVTVVAVALVGLAVSGCQLAGKGGKGNGPGGALTPEEFSDAFTAKMCDESQSCGDGSFAEMWCNPPETTGGTSATDSCTFDPEVARECLDAAYTCNDDLTGFEFVEPHGSCLNVFDCGTPPPNTAT